MSHCGDTVAVLLLVELVQVLTIELEHAAEGLALIEVRALAQLRQRGLADLELLAARRLLGALLKRLQLLLQRSIMASSLGLASANVGHQVDDLGGQDDL